VFSESLTEAVMTSAGLFGDLPETNVFVSVPAGAPRLREPVRDQVELRPVDLTAAAAGAVAVCPSQGIGRARALDRLCKNHDAYRWLCDGVSVNYHGLSDFRVAHPDLLDRPSR
jgi:hypothetical protein